MKIFTVIGKSGIEEPEWIVASWLTRKQAEGHAASAQADVPSEEELTEALRRPNLRIISAPRQYDPHFRALANWVKYSVVETLLIENLKEYRKFFRF